MRPRTWIITDTHFGHDMLHRRGFRPFGFEDIILTNLRQLQPSDRLIHLGDVSWVEDARWHHELWENCPAETRILVRGNHDRKRSDTWFMEHGWSVVVEALWISRYGLDIEFSHVPRDLSKMVPWPEYRNIHGHTHGNTPRHGEEWERSYDPRHHIEIALEFTNYQPVMLTENKVRNVKL